MGTLQLLAVQEVKPEVLIKVLTILIVVHVFIILAKLVLRWVHLDLHGLLARPRIRDEVLLELGWCLWCRLLSGWLWLLWRLLLRWLGVSGAWRLLRCLRRLGWSWLCLGLSRGFRRLLLLFLLLLLLSFSFGLVLVPLLKHLAHHIDCLVGLEILTLRWLLLVVRLLRLLRLRLVGLWLLRLRLLGLGLIGLWLLRLGLLGLGLIGLWLFGLWLLRLRLLRLRLLRLGLLWLFRFRLLFVHLSFNAVPVHIRFGDILLAWMLVSRLFILWLLSRLR